MVLWNCGHPANACVTLDMINSEGGAFLHRFSWIKDDSLIGEIPHDWNYLVEWYPADDTKPLPGAIHYTEGACASCDVPARWLLTYLHTC
jgi:hypothetical protein